MSEFGVTGLPTWEAHIYGHVSDPHGDDLECYDDIRTCDRVTAQEWANDLARVYPGYEVRVSNVADGFDYYDGQFVRVLEGSWLS